MECLFVGASKLRLVLHGSQPTLTVFHGVLFVLVSQTLSFIMFYQAVDTTYFTLSVSCCEKNTTKRSANVCVFGLLVERFVFVY